MPEYEIEEHRIDEPLHTGWRFIPQTLRRYFTDNKVIRSIAYLFGRKANKEYEPLGCTDEGYLLSSSIDYSSFYSVDLSKTTPLGSGLTEYYLLRPQKKELWKIEALLIHIPPPPAATSGKHALKLYYLFNTSLLNQVIGVSDYNNFLYFDCNYWRVANISQHPNTAEAQVYQVKNLFFDHNLPIRMSYTNGTNVNQTETRMIKLIVRRFKKGEIDGGISIGVS